MLLRDGSFRSMHVKAFALVEARMYVLWCSLPGGQLVQYKLRKTVSKFSNPEVRMSCHSDKEDAENT